jgi:manganese/zinc/iron transport system substrate-binding protein
VLVTTNIIADATRLIAGDQLRVEALMGAGTDPHLYKARFSDIRRLEEADLILYNGLYLEGKLADILALMPERAVAVTQVVPDERILRLDEQGKAIDPHVWFDASLWAMVVRGIGEELAALDPKQATLYRQRATAHAAALDSLHEAIRLQLATLPKDRRIMITAHDAFNYFGRAYGLQVRGLQGLSTVSEYGVKDVSNLVQFVRKHRIPAVFIESGISPRAMESVIAGCAQLGHTVRSGGQLYSDSLGPRDEPTGTYLGMMQHNVTTLLNALKP